MQFPIEIPETVLRAAVQEDLLRGEIGNKIAAHLADQFAGLAVYNRSEAAKYLRVGRATLIQHEKQGLIQFRAGKVSLTAMQEYLDRLASEAEREKATEEINRRNVTTKPRRRREIN